MHDREPVGHRQRLLLVVRDVEERDPDLALEALELDLQPAPQLRVERTERLVEEEHRRREDERARERDPLLLTARELVRPALAEAAEPDELEHSATRCAPLGLRHAREAEPERDVLSTVRCGKSA